MKWTGSTYAVIWSDWRDGQAELYYTALDAAGATMLEDTRITEAAGNSFGAEMAFGEGEIGILWTDLRDANYEVYFTSLSCNAEAVTD